MATPEIKPPAGVVKPSTAATTEQALKHLADVRKQAIDSFGGKTGQNPYLWINNVIVPLESLLRGEAKDDATVIAKALAVKLPEKTLA